MDFATVRDTAQVQAAINPMAAFWISLDTVIQAQLREMVDMREQITRMREILTNDPRLEQGALRTKEAATYIHVNQRTFERIAIDSDVPYTKLGTLKLWQRPRPRSTPGPIPHEREITMPGTLDPTAPQDVNAYIEELNTTIERLRANNATFMHQNGDLTRENELLKTEIQNLRSSAQSVDKAS